MITKSGDIQSTKYLENGLTSSTYTVVGTLTNNDGVFSGFAASKYLKCNYSIASNISGLEIYGQYNASNVASEQYIICTSTRNLSFKILNSKFVLQVSSNNGSSWNNVSTGVTTLVAGNIYEFKIVTSSSDVKFYIRVNGEWLLQGTITLPSGGTYTTSPETCFGLHVPSNAVPNGYSIDIKNFSIKKDGVMVWSGNDAYLINKNPKIGKRYISGSSLYEC